MLVVHRHIQSHVKHPRCSFLQNNFKPLTVFAKVSILGVWQVSVNASAKTFQIKKVFIKKINNFFILSSWRPTDKPITNDLKNQINPGLIYEIIRYIFKLLLILCLMRRPHSHCNRSNCKKYNMMEISIWNKCGKLQSFCWFSVQ